MLEKKISNIFNFNYPSNTAVCVTTNGCIRNNGYAVMGKGIALQAKNLFPNIDQKLGKYLSEYGNRAFNMGKYRLNQSVVNVFTFPTKNDWRNNSDIELIKKSCNELMQLCDKFNISTCIITKPGCGCGGLNYEKDVRPIISKILDNRFICCI